MEKGTGKHEEIVVNKKKSIRQMVFIDIVIKVSNCLLIACSWGIPGKKRHYISQDHTCFSPL